MLAYAANRPVVAGRPLSPTALAVVIALHAALIAAAISARMDIGPIEREPPIKVELIPQPEPPRPDPAQTPPRPATESHIERTIPLVPTKPINDPLIIDTTPFEPGPIVGPGTIQTPEPLPQPPVLARTEARLVTPAWELKPPYPMAKIASEEEAVLRLRITIDERGRVIAVEPLAPVDRAFLDSARRHLLSHWRYKPAMENGRPITSSMVIRLRFQLDG
jgi:periplasmic protein TonB